MKLRSIIDTLKTNRFLLVPLALGILLPSLFEPWITINLLGQHPFSPIDIIKSAVVRIAPSAPQNQFDLFLLFSRYTRSYFALIASMSIYLASLIMMLISIAGKNRARTLLIAGILAVATGIVWIYTVELLRDNFIQTAVSAGGIIGEEWKGQEPTIANSIVVIGIGHYLVILSGMIALLAYVWR